MNDIEILKEIQKNRIAKDLAIEKQDYSMAAFYRDIERQLCSECGIEYNTDIDDLISKIRNKKINDILND
jgi:hypothetical protein